MASQGRNVLAEYFANKDGEDLGRALWDKIEEYRQYLTASGRLVLWQNLYEAYYREYWMSGTNEKGGSHGQYTYTRINQFKSILDRLQSVITQQRVKWAARAANGDVQSLKQTILANELLDYYLRTKLLAEMITNTVNWGFTTTEGFMAVTWDSQLGKVAGRVQEDDGSMVDIHEGDIRAAVFDPTCVVRDVTCLSWEACDWVITIEHRNKYDEAAKYPELAEKIAALSLERTDEQAWHFEPNWWAPSDDQIAVYHFYHKKTPACPAGRYAKFYTSDMVVIETGLPYETIPVFRFSPAEHLGTPFGYSVAVNLLPIQETYDIVTNQIATNHELFGVQHVVGYEGSNLQYQQLANGTNYLEITPIPGVADPTPKGMNLLEVSADSYSYQTKLEEEMQVISGINAVARGVPPEGVTAGIALALIQSMAVQANMPAQQRYVQFLERLGSGIISILREYAAVPRIAEIAGKENRTFVKEFSSQDLNKVQRVFIELGNPLTDTVAGKVNMADNLLNRGMITTPQEYLTVINTGSLDPLTQGDQAELLLIRKENEMLSDGEPVQAIELDAHQIHINEHKAVLADPEARMNPALVQSVMGHIEAHKQFQIMEAQKAMAQQAAMSAPPAPPPMPGPPPGPAGPPPGPMHPPAGSHPGPSPAPALKAPVPTPAPPTRLPQPAQPPNIPMPGR